MGADFFVDNAQRLRVFGGDNQSARIAVNAVAQRRGERLFRVRIPFALAVQVRLYMVDERVDFLRFVGVDRLSRTLVRQQDVFVLVDNPHFRLKAFKEQIFLFFALAKERVIDI